MTAPEPHDDSTTHHAPGPRDLPDDPLAHRRGEPRVFAFVWTIFLMAATMLTFISVGPGGIGASTVYRPAARTLIVTLIVGILILWPMVRLSQARPSVGGFNAMRQDLFVILVPVQAVIWPQVILGGWSILRMTALDAVLISWASLTGALLALALGRPGSRRTHAGIAGWMCAFVLLVAAGFAPAMIAAPATASIVASPVTAAIELTSDEWTRRGPIPARQHWLAAAAPLLVSGPLWIWAWAISIGHRRGH